MKRKKLQIITQKNKKIYINIFAIKSIDINKNYIKINSKIYYRKDFNWTNWQHFNNMLNLFFEDI